MPQARSSNCAVSPRPRAGGRYSNNIITHGDWGKIVYPGGRKLWWRLVIAFIIMALFGASFFVLGAVFYGQAQQVHKDSGISLPVVWCIIGMVCGSIMIIGSFVLGKKMISSKWRRNQQPQYSHRNRTRHTQQATNDANVTYPPNRMSREESDDVSTRQESPPPPYEPLNNSTTNNQSLPPAAVFIISQGDVNFAISAPIIPNTQTDSYVMPPKYNELSVLEPPSYSEKDPLEPPKYAGRITHPDVQFTSSTQQNDLRQSEAAGLQAASIRENSQVLSSECANPILEVSNNTTEINASADSIYPRGTLLVQAAADQHDIQQEPGQVNLSFVPSGHV